MTRITPKPTIGRHARPESATQWPDEYHLGDGLYASFDGYQVWLSTERDGQKHEVALEARVIEKLIRYVHQLETQSGRSLGVQQ